MPFNTFIGAVCGELRDGEFPAIVGAQDLQLAPTFHLCCRLDFLDCFCRCVLGWQQHSPHKTGGIIDEQQDVAVAHRCCWRDWAAQITVHQFELILGTICCCGRKRAPPLLRGDTSVTYLLHMIDHRHPTCHLLLAESSECIEVQMAETFVPLPCLNILARRETDRLCSLEVQNVQPVLSSMYLGQQSVMIVPNVKHAMVNHNLGPSFIKLSQT
ncbi:ubiquitin-specific protease 7 [Zea mays]|nr:ubiquitin-specific protease 7 [Zea mays]